MKKIDKLHWFVFVENVNEHKIDTFDIMNSIRFRKEIEDIDKKLKKNKIDNLEEELRRSLMYCFWSKCEYEVVISGFPPCEKNPIESKIDVYDQIIINYDAFFNHVCNVLGWRN